MNLELGSDVISKGIGDLFVVGYDNISKYYRFVCKFRAPMERLEFLFQHPTSRTNWTGKLEKDEFVGVCGFEISDRLERRDGGKK